jgi:hypothetical protein
MEGPDFGQELLRRLAGASSDADVASRARVGLEDLKKEGPMFGLDDENLADVLKRCSLADQPGFDLSEDDLRRMLGRLASRTAPPPAAPGKGKFLACRRLGKWIPVRSRFVSSCGRCGAAIVFPASRIEKLRTCGGAVLCWRCAQAFPGRIVDIESA